VRNDHDDDGSLVLSDLVNRVLDIGVVVSGNVIISIADIDLVALDLRLLISSIETASNKQLDSLNPRGDADAPVLPAPGAK
jgi:hypothetical protein